MTDNYAKEYVTIQERVAPMGVPLDEFAAPRSSDLQKTYYHGTSTEAAGKGILQSKKITAPDLTKRQGKMRPIDNQVYLTPSIEYATIYALGANMLGSDMSGMVERGDDRYGYLFVIDGNSLVDIQPDEDSVGAMVADLFGDSDFGNYDLDKIQWLADLAEDVLGDTPYESDEDDGYAYHQSVLDAVVAGEAPDQALAGKLLIPYMSDAQKLSCIDAGGHVSNTGSIKFSEAWKFDKLKAQDLKRDGSNFFQLAERVTSANESLDERSKPPKAIYYHGTSSKNLRRILSQGLIPNPKDKSWGEDPGVGYSTPSRISYGGIYLTQNIVTATSSISRIEKRKGGGVIVIVEVQPRSLTADEDDVVFSLDHIPKIEMVHMVYELYLAYVTGTNSKWVTETQQQYADQFVEKVNRRLENGDASPMDPRQEERVRAILVDAFFAAMQRRVAHVPEGMSAFDQAQWRHFKSRDDFLTPPDKNKSEAMFRQVADQMTRTLRDVYAVKTRDFMQTARTLEPINFRGANKIVAIVELVPKEEGKYGSNIRVVYGKLPQEFITAWEARVGEVEIVEAIDEVDYSTYNLWDKLPLETREVVAQAAGFDVAFGATPWADISRRERKALKRVWDTAVGESLDEAKYVGYRGTGAQGYDDIRPSDTGVRGPGVYFYADPIDARAYAGRGGGVIVAEIDTANADYYEDGDPVIVAHDPSAIRVIGRVPTDRTLERDDYLDAIDAVVNESITEGRKDRLFRQKAEQVYRDTLEKTKQRKYNKPVESKWFFYVTGHGDLAVEFIYSKQAGGYNPREGLIVMGVSADLEKDSAYLWLKARKDIFIHEYIHYLDDKRMQGADLPVTGKIRRDSGDRAYFNDPREVNAYYQEYAALYLDEYVRMMDDEDFAVHYPNAREFVTNFLEYLEAFADQFYSRLDGKNLRKVQKRAMQLWYDVLAERGLTESIDEGAQDQKFRQIARGVFKDIDNQFAAGMRSGKLASIMARNGYEFPVPGHNVSLRFAQSSAKTGYGKAGSGRKVIQLAMPPGAKLGQFPQFAQAYWAALKEKFIHEFTHYLDEERIGIEVGSAKAYDATGDVADYFNSPAEYNAYWHEGTARYFDTIDGLSRLPAERFTASFQKFYGDFSKFYDMVIGNFTTDAAPVLKAFYTNLTPKNERKLKKRVAQLWQDLHDYARDKGAMLEAITEGARDQEFRQMARDAFKDLMRELKRASVKELELLLPFTDFGPAKVEDSFTLPGYPDVHLILRPETSISSYGTMHGHPDKKVVQLGLPNFTFNFDIALLSKGDDREKRLVWDANIESVEDKREAFIHEFIHHFDDLRTPDDQFGKVSQRGSAAQDAALYYNSPTEYNAYYQSIVSMFFDNVDKLASSGKVDLTRAFKSVYPDFRNFYKQAIDHLAQGRSPFWDNLTPDNKKRLKKRLAQTWEDLLQYARDKGADL